MYDLLHDILSRPARRYMDDSGPLVGRVLSVGVFTHDKWGDSPVVRVLTRGREEWKVFGFGAVLERELAAVQPGDWLGVDFLGTRQLDDGKETKDWRVVRIPADWTFDDSPPGEAEAPTGDGGEGTLHASSSSAGVPEPSAPASGSGTPPLCSGCGDPITGPCKTAGRGDQKRFLHKDCVDTNPATAIKEQLMGEPF